jgi:hypothetical protein
MFLARERLFESEDANHGKIPLARLRVRTFPVPLLRDAAVVGRLAPLSHQGMKKMLRLASPQPFAGIALRDDTVGSIFVRQAILRRMSWATVKNLVLQTIKPSMAANEILALYLEVEVGFGEKVPGGGGTARSWAIGRVLRCGADLRF